MGKIETLIQQYCPNGVEWKCLGDFCEIKTGKGVTKKDCVEYGEYPIISGGVEPMGYYHTYNREGRTVTISRVGANAGLVSFIEKRFYLNDKCFSVIPSNNTNTKFLFYILSSIENSIKGMQSEGGVPTINTQKVGGIEIPLPPLPVQEEIVKILDTFSELQAELQAELQTRRRQYDYYQDLLLNKSQFTQHISVGDVCDIIKGKTPIQKARDGIYPLVVTTLERKSCDTYQFNTNAVCIPLVSSRGHGVASLNHVFYQEGKFALGNILCAVIPRETILKAKFLYYYLEYAKDFILVPLMKGGANVSLHSYDIEKVKIPLPTIQEQERIIAILDTFDALVNDLSQGIPAEIEARKQQYEFYRDKLLTFKKKV